MVPLNMSHTLVDEKPEVFRRIGRLVAELFRLVNDSNSYGP
jgi:hypothetical protein